MSDKFQYDVFLSYKSDDHERVSRLAERLRAAGLRVWFDDWLIKPGDDIYLTIERGLTVSRTLVLCMSPATFTSGWVNMERSTVLFRDPDNDQRRFIPLLLADCQIPDTLRRYKYVDFRKEADEAFEELVTACCITDEHDSKPAAAEKANKFPLRSGKEPPSKQHTEDIPLNLPNLPKETAPTSTPQEDAPLATLERKIEPRGDYVRRVAISPNGEWAACAQKDQTITVWELKTGECIATLRGHTDEVICVAFTPDGQYLLSGSFDYTVRVWDVGRAKQITVLHGHTLQVLDIAPLSDGVHVVACSGNTTNDGMLALWNIQTGECAWSHQNLPLINRVATTPDGLYAITGSHKIGLELWDLRTGDIIKTIKSNHRWLHDLAVTSDGRYVVIGLADKTIQIWDLNSGTCVGTLEGHQDDVYAVAISEYDSLIASTGFTDHTVRLWDFKSGECLQVIQVSSYPNSVALDRSGTKLLVGTPEEGVYVYRLRALKPTRPAEPIRRYMNAKIVLLGESGVGKSGLAHRLIEDEFVKTESTHGMKVWRLDLPLDNKDGMEREALLWDLAGQEDYRLIHQLFLDETALALMLINPQKDDPFAEVGDWLKALRVAVSGKDAKREVARLLVGARTDVGDVKVSRQKIDRFMKEQGFADYVATSAARGDNCSDKGNGGQPSQLKRLIARHIDWDALPWTSTPKLLADVKSAVLDMAEKKEIRLLRFAELCQRLEQALTGQSITEADARTAVTLLANHGLVMPLKFGDLVLLRPELMNGYAGAVIRAARAHTDEIGSVCERDVYGERFDFSGVERLERPDEELLLRAMVQTFLDKSLCIAEDTSDGRQLIFPSQYRRERPIPAYPEIFVSYGFAGELQTIYTTLVVRLWYSRQFEQKELWRNAAEFVTTKGKTVGLVMERAGEGLGTISAFFEEGVPDELKVVFIEFVHRHLERYAREVRRDRRYVCPKCSTAVTDYNAVRRRLDAGKEFITCQMCDKRVPLIDHIEQRLGSDPVARKVRDMEERDRRERDTQALEQILIGHMMAVCGEANQIFRQVSMPEYGIDGEVEFKDKDGRPSGKKIYVRLKNDNRNMTEAFGYANGYQTYIFNDEPYAKLWEKQAADVYLVIRDATGAIRWMNVTRYLKGQNQKNRTILFEGERLDAPAVWRVRDEYFPRPVVS